MFNGIEVEARRVGQKQQLAGTSSCNWLAQATNWMLSLVRDELFMIKIFREVFMVPFTKSKSMSKIKIKTPALLLMLMLLFLVYILLVLLN